VRVDMTSPSLSMVSRIASARSKAWQARHSISRPATASTLYSDVTLAHKLVPCLPKARGGAPWPLRGLTIFRFGLLLIWSLTVRVILAQQICAALFWAGGSV
jgi:hypothetical protein